MSLERIRLLPHRVGAIPQMSSNIRPLELDMWTFLFQIFTWTTIGGRHSHIVSREFVCMPVTRKNMTFLWGGLGCRSWLHAHIQHVYTTARSVDKVIFKLIASYFLQSKIVWTLISSSQHIPMLWMWKVQLFAMLADMQIAMVSL